MATSDLDAKLISQGAQVTSVDGAALVPVATAEGQPQQNITVSDLADSMGAQAAESVNITSLWGQTEDGKMVRITNQSAANIIGSLLYGATTASDLASVVAGSIEKQNTTSVVLPANTIVNTGITTSGIYRVWFNNELEMGYIAFSIWACEYLNSPWFKSSLTFSVDSQTICVSYTGPANLRLCRIG